MIRSTRTLGLVSLLGGLVSLAPAVVWSDDITDADVLAFGNDSRFSGVGILGSDGAFGTGTFIGVGNGKSWVITASHVLATGGIGDFVLPGGSRIGLLGRYDMGGDVMVAEVETNAQGLFGAYVPKLNLGTIDVGVDVVSAGFGIQCSQSAVPNYTWDGRRRGFQSRVAGAWFDGLSNFVSDRFDAPGDPFARSIEGMGAPGDSGSMLLRESDGAILGVLSNGDQEKYGNTNNYAMLTPEKSREIYRLTGIDPVPEPASLCVLGLGALAILRRRKAAWP